MQQQEQLVAVKVWDLPTRLFHWVLTAILVFQIFTGYMGGGRVIEWHAYSGYCILALIVFRVMWGFAGSTHARFASFMAGPGATLRFARRLFSRQAVPQVGHNPLGGWNVIGMIVVIGIQAVLGLFANDGAAFEGPLAKLVSLDFSNAATRYHRWTIYAVIALAGVHILAVLFHWLVKKENLIGAMFTGVKLVPESVLRERRQMLRGSPRRRAASREQNTAYIASSRRALVLFVISAILVVLVVRVFR